MNEQSATIIKEAAEKLLQKAGFVVRTEITSTPDPSNNGTENIVCNIITEGEGDSSYLIGQYGANLQAFQHLVRLLVRRQTEEHLRFTLDVNQYRQEKDHSLVEQAHLAAAQVIEEGQAITLRPMTAYERRVVHLELSKNNQVTTESIGEGEERQVIVKPVNLT
ncbi:hypothetical protein EPO05_02815 [Patescibacteria group bacterium]|nr:MAG: hypothetical protein EPO05_02815 [Patescibacteria group bacterium]